MHRGDDRRRAMALLGIVISLRSVAWFTLLAFVPLWVVSLGHSKADGNRLLFVMLLSGAAGTLSLGPVADRIGLRVTLVVTQALLTPLILAFVYVGGALGVVALMLVGVCVVGTFGVTMVLSQLYLPRHVGMASGLSVGLAMGIGGLAAVASGAIADAVGLKTALTISATRPCARGRLLPQAAGARGASRGPVEARRRALDRLALRREPERAALGVATDRPALARVHDVPAELDDPLERSGHVRAPESRAARTGRPARARARGARTPAPSPWLCKPSPSAALRSSRANPSSPSQNCRARARSSAGNSIKSIGVTHSAYAACAASAATVGP